MYYKNLFYVLILNAYDSHELFLKAEVTLAYNVGVIVVLWLISHPATVKSQDINNIFWAF
jgi:hypothetical protein